MELGTDVTHVDGLQPVDLKNVYHTFPAHDAAHAVMRYLKSTYLERAVRLRTPGQGNGLAAVVTVVLVTDEQLVGLETELGVAGRIIGVVRVDNDGVAVVSY